MTEETKQERAEPSENALLAEYQACQSHNNALSTEFWAVTAIMMSISVALLGGIFYTTISNSAYITLPIKIFISAIGFGMIFILGFVMFWLKRIQFMERVHHHRMREIEDNLSMEKNWLIHGLDLNHYKKINEVPDRMKQKVKDLNEIFLSLKPWDTKKFFYRYESPKGSQVVFSIFNSVILFWILLISSIWTYIWVSLLITLPLALGIYIFIRKTSKEFS